MKNPTPKPQQINWDEFDKLLVPETPGPGWVSGQDLAKHYGLLYNKGKYRRLVKMLEAKKFRGLDGNIRNYYKVKK